LRLDVIRIDLPQCGKPCLVLLAILRRHIVPGEGFQCRFIGANLEDIVGDGKFFERFPEVEAVDAETVDIDTAHRVDDDLVGICGEVILRLAVIVFGRDDRFAGTFKLFKCLADGLQLVQPGIVHVFQIEEQHRYAVI